MVRAAKKWDRDIILRFKFSKVFVGHFLCASRLLLSIARFAMEATNSLQNQDLGEMLAAETQADLLNQLLRGPFMTGSCVHLIYSQTTVNCSVFDQHRITRIEQDNKTKRTRWQTNILSGIRHASRFHFSRIADLICRPNRGNRIQPSYYYPEVQM